MIFFACLVEEKSDAPTSDDDDYQDEDILKEASFAVDDEIMRKEYRDVIYSVIRDNISNDLKKLHEESKGEKLDEDSSQETGDDNPEKRDFTANLKRSIMEEIDDSNVEDASSFDYE